MPEQLRVGGLSIATDEAEDIVRRYVGGEEELYAYPYYDRLVTGADPTQLVEADLLAPVLLNVQVRIRTFRDLQRLLPRLQACLDALPIHLDLADADDAVLTSVGRCFAVLDDPSVRPWGAKGTTIAKVLHRKRPRLLPLYDKRVRRVYQASSHGAPRVRSTPEWVPFMTALATEMRQDLDSARGQWHRLCSLGRGGLTELRALDIVAWTLGGRTADPSGPPNT